MRTYHFWDQKNQSARFNTVKALRESIALTYGEISVEKIEHMYYTKKLCSQWKISYTIPLHNNGKFHGFFYIEVRQPVTLQEEKPTLFHSLENLLTIYNSLVTHPYNIIIKVGEFYLEPYHMMPLFIGKNEWEAKETLIEKIQVRQYCLAIEAIG